MRSTMVAQAVRMLTALRTHLTPRRPALPGGRPFHLLVSSLAVSSIGDWLYNVALLAYVFERTHSPAWLAAAT